MAQRTPRPRRSDRSETGARRDPSGGASRRTAGGAQATRRSSTTTRRRDTPSGPRISWSRRTGLVLGLILLGGSIALAGGRPGGGTGGGDPSGSPGTVAVGSGAATDRSTPPDPSAATSAEPTRKRPPPPVLEAGTETLTRGATWTARGTIPESVVGKRGFRIRISVNDRLVRQVAVPRRASFSVGDVPLVEGANEITATIAGRDAESRDSEAVVVTRDTTAPAITITDPPPGRRVNANTVTLRGTTEAAATVTGRNTTREGEPAPATVTAGPDGAFELRLPLGEDVNAIALEAVDPAGNRATSERRILRGDGEPAARVTMSSTRIPVDRLPTRVSLFARVRDADGVPIDGATVTFSLSPPGLPTATYRAVTVEGQASWTGVSLPAEGAFAGKGFATVMVVLEDGTVLRDTAEFLFL